MNLIVLSMQMLKEEDHRRRFDLNVHRCGILKPKQSSNSYTLYPVKYTGSKKRKIRLKQQIFFIWWKSKLTSYHHGMLFAITRPLTLEFGFQNPSDACMIASFLQVTYAINLRGFACRNESLRVAYVDEVTVDSGAPGKTYYSRLVKVDKSDKTKDQVHSTSFHFLLSCLYNTHDWCGCVTCKHMHMYFWTSPVNFRRYQASM